MHYLETRLLQHPLESSDRRPIHAVQFIAWAERLWQIAPAPLLKQFVYRAQESCSGKEQVGIRQPGDVSVEVRADRMIVGWKDGQEQPAGLEHSERFGQACLRILHVFKPIVAQDHIQAGSGDRKFFSNADYER